MSSLSYLTKWALGVGLNASDDGWLLMQNGNHYELCAVDRGEDNDTLLLERDGDQIEITDELGLMHQLNGVPLGLASDASPATSGVRSDAADDALPDGGEAGADATVSLQEIGDEMNIETVSTATGVAHLINPWLHRREQSEVVDIRPTARLFRGNATPQTPRKTAENAVEDERNSGGMDVGQLTEYAMLLGAFVVGGIMTEFIAGSSSGGGVEVPLNLSPAVDLLMITLSTLL